MKAIFVVNPRSGRRRSFDVAAVIRDSCPFEHEILGCEQKQQLDEIVDRAESEEFDAVFAVGGDGTVHETARRLIGRRPALGVVPIGSGNGFARHLGIPLQPAAAVAAAAHGAIVSIDSAAVNDVPFAGVMGVGFDAAVAHDFAASESRGLRTYVRVGLRAFASAKPQHYSIEAGDRVIETNAMLVAVANSAQYGNDARIAPRASLVDGLLDIVVIEEPSLPAAAVLLRRLFDGTLDRAAGVVALQAPAVRIRRERPGPAHLDGEPVMLDADLRVAVCPRSLRVLVPDPQRRL